MAVALSSHFTYKKIFRITLFPIIMMVFTSLYSIVDGVFVSNFSTNKSSFAAVNLVFPFVMIIGSIGLMLGSGGSALVSKTLGEKNEEKANKTFSLIIYTAIVLGAIISIASFFAVDPIVRAMAKLSPDNTEDIISEAIKYGRILCAGQVFFILQNCFQTFLMTAEKPHLGFVFTLTAGVANMIFDAILIAGCKLGIEGAGYATVIGYFIGGAGPLLYFIFNKKCLIYLGKTTFVLKDILKTMYNGMSEFVSNIAGSIVSIIYNALLLKTYGEVGVSAYGIIMYISFIFIAIFIGYSTGLAPAISYHYGAKNTEEIKNILKKSFLIISITSIAMFLISLFAARPFSLIFARGDDKLLELSTLAMRIFSVSFLFIGLSIFTSSFFTALNNGTISAIVSLFRTFIFQVGFLFLFNYLFPGIGIWWAIVAGEGMAIILSLFFIFTNGKKYQYL